MAYGNWGAFVYRNGERVRENEDAAPFPKQADQPFVQHYHAVLGNDRVRLIGYKHWPALYVNAEPVPLDDFMVVAGEDSAWAGTFEGHEFKATQNNGNMIDLWMKEPDGSVWNATCGYCYGAGHMD